MANASGPGGAGDAGFKPIEPSQAEQSLGIEGENLSGSDVEAALHTKVRTLGQLKSMLIGALGEKEGTAVYNRFLQSMAMLMIDQLQQSARGAARATKGMSGSQ